jgi:hypothetical protein
MQSGPGTVSFGDTTKTKTTAKVTGPGIYVLKLSATDGQLQAADTVTITVEPFSARVNKVYSPIEDAFLEGGTGHNTQHLKVEPKRRVIYLKFHVTGLPAKVIRATLKLTENGDTGGGILLVHRGSYSDWSETSLTPSTAPAPQDLTVKKDVRVGAGQTIEIDVTPLVTGNGTFTVVLTLGTGGNDIWFGSKNSSQPPELTVTAEDLH